MGLAEVVPFLVEDELVAKGAEFSKVGNFERRAAHHRPEPGFLWSGGGSADHAGEPGRCVAPAVSDHRHDTVVRTRAQGEIDDEVLRHGQDGLDLEQVPLTRRRGNA
ncbi:hypothetical protein ACGFIW_18520 [Micromonospora sp. NPDC048935]|uniref:hypothetical protein n=1 Tax=Micromonospora sp. NPDC048935 TaxID=3364262 RepID=UPI00371673E3